MKKFKNYIETELAKKKIARYRYWSVKDENGITISSSDEESEDNKSFNDLLDHIIKDNVDAEIQVKYGTNEQSSRNNPPFFIKINEEIEWIEPEEETVTINGKPHKVDKNGNVNISFTQPEYPQLQEPKIEKANIDYVRQEMDMQLSGMRKEYELKEEKWQIEMNNKLAEQMNKFTELMLNKREHQISEREQKLAIREARIEEKEKEIRENVSGYLKQVPAALGGLLKEMAKPKEKTLGKADEKKKKPVRRAVNFAIEEPEEEVYEEEIEQQNAENDTENDNPLNENEDEKVQD